MRTKFTLILSLMLLTCITVFSQNKEPKNVLTILYQASDSAKHQTNRELKANRYTKMFYQADSAFNLVVSKEKQIEHFKSQLKVEDIYIYHLVYNSCNMYQDRLLYLLINDMITTREYLFLIQASEELSL